MGFARLGIRREDKNRWERRVPLTPAAVHDLRAAGVNVTIQPSQIRVFPDDEYRAAGAVVADDLTGCRVVVGVKEIPVDLIHGPAVYMFFSHTAKAQAHNLPLLARVLDTGATLIDYEGVVDARGARLIHFGRFAGIAGTIDGLAAYGRRMAALGVPNPFTTLRPAWRYGGVHEALADVARLGRMVARDGLPPQLGPMIVGVTGYGNAAGGAHEVLDRLRAEHVSPDDLSESFLARLPHTRFHRVSFREEDTVIDRAGRFDRVRYRSHPVEYRSHFSRFLPSLSILVNCVYWSPGSPRLVARDDLARLLQGSAQPRLAVIADVSCDIGGGIEATVRATTPDHPVYVYDPAAGTAVDGVAGPGFVILAVDNLPCELPKDATRSFSDALAPWVAPLIAADLDADFASLGLPPELKSAVIAHRGSLAPRYAYLAQPLRQLGIPVAHPAD